MTMKDHSLAGVLFVVPAVSNGHARDNVVLTKRSDGNETNDDEATGDKKVV